MTCNLVKHLYGAFFVGIFIDLWQIISFFNINLFTRGIVYKYLMSLCFVLVLVFVSSGFAIVL